MNSQASTLIGWMSSNLITSCCFSYGCFHRRTLWGSSTATLCIPFQCTNAPFKGGFLQNNYWKWVRETERASCPSLQDHWSRAKTALAFHPDTEVLPNVSATANWFILAFSHFLLLWMRTTVRLTHRKLLMIPVKPLERCGRIGYPARGKTGAMAWDTTMIIQL